MRGEGLTMTHEPREVDPKDFQRITYRGVGLAAFKPFPMIRWRKSDAGGDRKPTYRGVGLAAFNPNPNIVRRTRSPRVPTVTARKNRPATIPVPLPSESVRATLRQAIDNVERARDVRQAQRRSRRGWLRSRR